MSEHEWKPGDVGEWQYGGSTQVALRVRRCPNDNHAPGPHWHTSDGGWSETDEHVRPLVVIDPEDREQVERLANGLRDGIEGILRVSINDYDLDRIADRLQAALREFATPTPPKPDEPTGLGAVVEDDEGVRWVLNNPRGIAKWSRINAAADGRPRAYREWRNIAAVRVLSEGVR